MDKAKWAKWLAVMAAITCLALARHVAPVTAQEGDNTGAVLRITQVDISDFPEVRLNLFLADEANSPITDLSGLELSEKGVPVEPIQVSRVPVGVSLIVVLDANQSLELVDSGHELTRRELARNSIARYASEFMDPGGLDRVSIIVPDEEEPEAGRFLLAGATLAAQVIEEINGYVPENPPFTTPLQKMMELALAQAEIGQASHQFQALLLMTNGEQLDAQLDFELLTAQAEALHLPIYAAILGSRADPNEVANVTRLAEPARGFYVHMPAPTDTDPIYTAIQAHSRQAQIRYRSGLNRSGRVTLAVSLGPLSDSATFDLALAAPQVNLLAGSSSSITRLGQNDTSPLITLQPSTVELEAEVTFPDGFRREIAQVNLVQNGVLVPAGGSLAVDERGRLPLVWDVSTLDAGTFELAVQLVDELGLSARSAALPFTIAIERPEARPTVAPTPAPTLTPSPIQEVNSVVQRAPGYLAGVRGLAAMGGLLAIAGLLMLLRRRRLRRAAAALFDFDGSDLMVERGERSDRPAAAPQAYLERLGGSNEERQRLPLQAAGTTLGRDAHLVDLLLAEPSVSRLHARISERDGAFWLYDEGSASGTYLNFERIGLMPQRLQDNDDIHIGRVHLRFHLRQTTTEQEENEP